MVRRGSTVRVRQRALRRKSPEIGDFLLSRQAAQSTFALLSGGLFSSLRGCKAPQIEMPPGSPEQLREREGIDSRVAGRGLPRTAWKSAMWPRTHARGASRASLGIGFGDAPLAATDGEVSVLSTTGSSGDHVRWPTSQQALTVGAGGDKPRAASVEWRTTGARLPVCRHLASSPG
jgi:hypothetical protein